MINKYARMVETMMDDIFGFCIVNARCKNVFCIFGFLNGRKCKVDKSCWKGVSYD
jgi:hypothetical protein